LQPRSWKQVDLAAERLTPKQRKAMLEAERKEAVRTEAAQQRRADAKARYERQKAADEAEKKASSAVVPADDIETTAVAAEDTDVTDVPVSRVVAERIARREAKLLERLARSLAPLPKKRSGSGSAREAAPESKLEAVTERRRRRAAKKALTLDEFRAAVGLQSDAAASSSSSSSPSSASSSSSSSSSASSNFLPAGENKVDGKRGGGGGGGGGGTVESETQSGPGDSSALVPPVIEPPAVEWPTEGTSYDDGRGWVPRAPVPPRLPRLKKKDERRPEGKYGRDVAPDYEIEPDIEGEGELPASTAVAAVVAAAVVVAAAENDRELLKLAAQLDTGDLESAIAEMVIDIPTAAAKDLVVAAAPVTIHISPSLTPTPPPLRTPPPPPAEGLFVGVAAAPASSVSE
jgi:hypothetical protein